MKIAFLITQLEPAGSQKAMAALVRGVREHGHDVRVFAMYDKSDYLAAYTESCGVPVTVLDMKNANGTTSMARVLKGCIRLRKELRDFQPAILQCFTRMSNIVGPVVGATAGIPWCITSQRASWRESSRLYYFVDRMVANSRLVDCMTAVSSATADFSADVEGVRREKLRVIRNGVESAERPVKLSREQRVAIYNEARAQETDFLFLCVARMHPQKDHRMLLNAFCQVHQQNPDIRLVLIGAGELLESIRAYADSLGLQDVVLFAGRRNDVPEWMAASDALVLASRFEGLPNIVLEAFADHLPVVATAVDGTAELVTHEETGLLCEPGDAASFATNMLRIMEDKDLRACCIRQARKLAEAEYSWPNMVNQFLDLYAEVSGNPARPGEERMA